MKQIHAIIAFSGRAAALLNCSCSLCLGQLLLLLLVIIRIIVLLSFLFSFFFDLKKCRQILFYLKSQPIFEKSNSVTGSITP